MFEMLPIQSTWVAILMWDVLYILDYYQIQLSYHRISARTGYATVRGARAGE